MNSVAADRTSRRDIRAGRKTFVATVIAVYLAIFAFSWPSFTPIEIMGLIAAGGAYLLVGLYGAELYIRTGSAFVLALFYAFEVPLGGLIVYWTAGFFLAGLIMLPLASLAVQVLPRPWMVIVCALLVMALGVAYGLRGDLEAGLLAGIGYLAAVVFVVFVTQVAVREREARAEVERLAAELADANHKLREYALQAEELAITRERARLAHEIHDTVGHTLTALDIQLELLARLPPGQTEQRRRVAEQARILVKEGLADVRRAVQALRPAALETFSLPEAITALVTDFEQTARISITWHVGGEITPLPLHLALPLYRAAQEALTNVQRHAPAAGQVTLRLHYGPEAVTLSVKNDGVGPPSVPPKPGGEGGEVAAAASEGYGLRGLREQAEALPLPRSPQKPGGEGDEATVALSEGYGLREQAEALPPPRSLQKPGEEGGEATVALSEGYGLRGLRERAEALGGAFSAGPDEAGGFRVEMHLPVTSYQ